MSDLAHAADAERGHLSPTEFARRTGLSVTTVRRYVRAGKLPHIQPGGFRGRILIPADALEMLRQPAGTAEDPCALASELAPSTPSGPRPRWLRGMLRS